MVFSSLGNLTASRQRPYDLVLSKELSRASFHNIFLPLGTISASVRGANTCDRLGHISLYYSTITPLPRIGETMQQLEVLNYATKLFLNTG